MDFIFSKEGQQTLADGGAIATMPGLRLANPDLDLKGKKLIPYERVTDAEREAFLKSFSAKYNLAFP